MNRHNTVDPVSELFERVNISFKKRELSLLLIVGVIGCIGTMSVFNRSYVKDHTTSTSVSTIKIPNEAKHQEFLENLDPYLNIGGAYECHKPMVFTIFNHNPKALYEVDYGDGTVQKGYAAEFKHIYKKDGPYEVKLIIHYKEESNTIFGTQLNISPSNQSLLSSL
jgi:uncharacterized protein (DUF2249 family)